MKNEKKRAITDLDVPSGSQDIPFQSQEFEHGRRNIVRFQPHFHLTMTSQTQSCKTIKNISRVLFDLFLNFAGY